MNIFHSFRPVSIPHAPFLVDKSKENGFKWLQNFHLVINIFRSVSQWFGKGSPLLCAGVVSILHRVTTEKLQKINKLNPESVGQGNRVYDCPNFIKIHFQHMTSFPHDNHKRHRKRMSHNVGQLYTLLLLTSVLPCRFHHHVYHLPLLLKNKTLFKSI